MARRTGVLESKKVMELIRMFRNDEWLIDNGREEPIPSRERKA
ncbi:hypothetical protein [Gracilibacillus xinjiangensis]|uniref:Fur-regulated basic protein FbpA n=1 Tax=Gracilibacillus xinjiangensis TaxID=1193282 RepID=A0ABV8WSG0_9BACI